MPRPERGELEHDAPEVHVLPEAFCGGGGGTRSATAKTNEGISVILKLQRINEL